MQIAGDMLHTMFLETYFQLSSGTSVRSKNRKLKETLHPDVPPESSSVQRRKNSKLPSGCIHELDLSVYSYKKNTYFISVKKIRGWLVSQY